MQQQKIYAALFMLALLGAAALPVRENWRAKPRDNFPLSYYPMFSYKRQADYTMNYVVGYDAQGQRHIIPYPLIGSGGFNQVRRQVNKRCRRGKAHKVARTAAKRIARKGGPQYQHLVKLEVLQGTFNIERFFLHHQRTPHTVEVLAARKMPRQNP